MRSSSYTHKSGNIMKPSLSYTLAMQFCVVASMLSTPSIAQISSDSNEDIEMETITVVGNTTNSIVSASDLDAYQANDLADVFRLTPSISVGGGASGIAQKIYIRGLEDTLVNVTVDGAPQTSTLFHHIGRVTIDPTLLERVQVQAGAGEATSGAGTIGGAIRFQTKDVNDLLAEDARFGGTVRINSFSNDGEQYNASLYGRLNDSWGVLAYYSDTDRDNTEDGNGVEMDGTAAEQMLGFIKISGEIGDSQRLSLSYEKREEEGEFTRWPNWSPLEAAPLYSGEGERETIIVNYQLQRGKLLNLETSFYQTESSFQRDLYTWNSDLTSIGFDIRNTSQFGNHSFTYGIDYRDDKAESGEIGTVQYKEEGGVMGIYAQGHTLVTNALLFSYGIRYDDYDFDQKLDNDGGEPLADVGDTDVSLNAGFEYSLTDEWKISLGYAEAARGLEITDGFTNWGTTVATTLEAETVVNIEVAVAYSIANFSGKASVFRSEIDDVIFDQSSGAVFYENIGAVETDGFEVDLVYRWQQLEFNLGYASLDAELDPAEGVFSADYGNIDLEGYEFKGLGNSRGDTWNFGVSAVIGEQWTMGWNVSHVEDLDNIKVMHRSVELGWIDDLQEIDKSGYTVNDVYLQWQPSDSVKLNLAVINLFDKAYRDHSSVGDYTSIPGWEVVSGYNEAGRDIRLSASYSF